MCTPRTEPHTYGSVPTVITPPTFAFIYLVSLIFRETGLPLTQGVGVSGNKVQTSSVRSTMTRPRTSESQRLLSLPVAVGILTLLDHDILGNPYRQSIRQERAAATQAEASHPTGQAWTRYNRICKLGSQTFHPTGCVRSESGRFLATAIAARGGQPVNTRFARDATGRHI